MNQFWFEMHDLKRRKLNSSVWIPLRSAKEIRNTVRFGYVGYQEEFLGHGSIVAPIDKKGIAYKYGWNDIGINSFHRGRVADNVYEPSDIFQSESFNAINLVLNQHFNSYTDSDEWHLHQDLVVTLGLKREKDIWVCPSQGYIEAARMERNANNSPVLLEIRNQFLKDYLCARKCGLYITSFFSRDIICDDKSFLSWNENSIKEKDDKNNWEWECRTMEIHEGGHPFGQKIAISHVGRTDIDENDDIPDMTSFPSDENVKDEFWEKENKGKKLYRIIADLWKNEWIDPGKHSPIILGDNDPNEVFFIVNEEGSKKSGKSLIKGGRWLWFKADVINALSKKRGGFLDWYSRDTGSVACSPDWGVHFGVNELGLITVYAKDIGELPEWQQQIWAACNVPPEGGISKELHASQVHANPASTLAPEAFIEKGINDVNTVSQNQLGILIFRKHEATTEIVKSIHRFRTTSESELYSLAKDMARIITDDINTDTIQQIVKPSGKEKWGSLKSLEKLLAIKVGEEASRKILSPFVGVYELRHGDAHLPSSKIEDSFNLLQLERNKPLVTQAYQMLRSCVDSLYLIHRIIEKWDQ